MSRKFIALVLAASVSITAVSTAPARAADPDDIAKILGAAATLFIIGKAIENARDDDDKPKAKDRNYQSPGHYKTYRKAHKYHSKKTYRKSPPVVIGRSLPRKHIGRSAPLPAACALDVRSGHRTFRVLGERCLSRNYSSAKALPSKCKLNVETRRGVRPAYEEQCLHRYGYRTR